MLISPITLLESNDTPSVGFGSVQISEIDYNGYASFDEASTSATKEAIEITNTSTEIIELTDWQLRIVSGNTDKSILFPATSLAPSEVFVFVRGLDIPKDIKGINYTGSLDNTDGAFIELRDSQGVTIDSFNHHGEWSESLEEDTHSLQKISSQWKSCSASLALVNTCHKSKNSSEEIPESNHSTPTEEDTNLDEKEGEATPLQPEEFTLRINEIFPNPEGSDSDFEFVELYNYGDEELPLAELSLDDIQDGGSSPQPLTGAIEPKQYRVFQGKDLSISLNNSGDEVHLIHQPSQTIIDSLVYTKDQVSEGKSIGIVEDGMYVLDSATPGKENQPNSKKIEDSQSNPESKKEALENPEKELEPFTLSKGIILINEILPNPDGKDTEGEFIELYNTSPDKVSLSNWQLRIDTKTFPFDDHTIEGEEHLAILRPESKLTLSNSKTFTVELLAPTGEIYDSVTINDQKDHHAYSKHTDTWSWTSTPTPGTPNIITQAITSSSKESENIPEVSLSEIYNQEHNSKLSTEGVVIRRSNLNAKYIYISNGEDIIKVYSTKKELDSLQKGQHIKVSGTWFSNENNTYLRIKDFSEDIKILGTANIPTHAVIATSDLTLLPLFHNVTITGTVDNQSGKTWNLVTLDSTIKVELAKDRNLEKPEFTKGDTMTVTGFIDIERGVRRVILSNTSQISITAQEPEKETQEDTKESENSAESPQPPEEPSLSSLIQATITQTIPQGFAFIKPYLKNPYILGLITLGGIGIASFVVKDFIKKPK